MRPLYIAFALIAIATMLSPAVTVAAETEADVLLEKLNELNSSKSRSLAKRWEGLIRLRQWKSSSGKHTTFAKYVAHSPDLTSIKLLVSVRNDGKRTEKLVDVPIDKLDRDAQVLLKRIANARVAVEELVGKVEATTEESMKSSASERNASGPEKPDSQAATRSKRKKLKNSRIGSRRIVGPGSAPNFNSPDFPDEAPWRTNYDAFIRNLLSTPNDPENTNEDISNWQLDWGKLQALRWQWELVGLELTSRNGQMTPEQQNAAQKRADEARPKLGEVVWTGVLKEDLPTDSNVEIEFDLPQPTPPFRVAFFLDDDFLEAPLELQKGAKVKFIGRFKSIGIGTATILVHVRFPFGQPANEISDFTSADGDSLGLPPGVEESLRKRGYVQE